MLTTVFKYYDINPIMTLLDCNIWTAISTITVLKNLVKIHA